MFPFVGSQGCQVCAAKFKTNGGCAVWDDYTNVQKKIPPGCDVCAGDAAVLCGRYVL